MKFAMRRRITEIVLAPGQTKHYLLPPMTQGTIQVSVFAVFLANESNPLDDGKGIPRGIAIPNDEASLFASDGPGRDDSLRTVSVGGADSGPSYLGRADQDGPDGPAAGTDSNPTHDVALELRCYRRKFKTEDVGVLIHTVGESMGWNIVFRRTQDVYLQLRRRFRVVVTYPSVLPEEERRIPLQFLRRGFDSNWNKPQGGVQYLQSLRLEGKKLYYKIESFFAAMYDLPKEGNSEIDLSFSLAPSSLWWVPGISEIATIDLTLPQIVSVPPISIGVGVDNEANIGLNSPVYFELTINLRCTSSRTLHISGLPDAELPAEFWIKARFYLGMLDGGTMIYRPKLSTSVTADYIVADGRIREKIKGKLREAEDWLFAAQRDDEHKYLFDKHLKPWMIGNYELTGIRYDAGADELVLTHVGKPVVKPIELSADPNTPKKKWHPVSNPQPYLMFKTEGEKWGKAESLVGDGRPNLPNNIDPGHLSKINHIVVLMQENRSFDHVLGYLSRDLGKTEIEGLRPGENSHINECDRVEWRDDGIVFKPQRISETSWPADVDSPCHSHSCTMEQMADGMAHFVANFAKRVDKRKDAQRVMNYFGRGALKTFDLLTDHFAICDHWFGSHIGGTLPNRHIAFSGDLNRTPDNIPEEENSDLKSYCASERTTFFDHLTRHGVSWKLYEHGYSFLRLYRNYTFDVTKLRPFHEFKKAAANGQLPAVSFIEPDYIEAPRGNDDHAPADMREGQRLIADIVRTLIRSEHWQHTMLIITYDEHGGFYDHVVPPDSIEVTGAGGSTTTRSIPPIANGIRQLGPRVPAFVISPYTFGPMPDPDALVRDDPPLKLNVSKKVYEHASIPATILRRFCSSNVPYLSERVSQANDLRSLLQLPADAPRLKDQFEDLLAKLDEIVEQTPFADVPPRSDRLSSLLPGSPDEREDFHGFLMVASALTGRGEQ